MRRERHDDPSAAFEGRFALPCATNGSILAMEPALSWEFRLVLLLPLLGFIIWPIAGPLSAEV
jgi:hypothetical protein